MNVTQTLSLGACLGGLCLGAGAARAQAVPAVRSVSASPAVDGEVSRPLIVPAGGIQALYGLGVAASRLGGGDTLGPGLHLAFQFGVVRGLDLELSTGVRVGDDGGTLAADRYARIGRESLYQVGTGTLANPTLRVRYGIVDGASSAFQLGVELRGVMPLVAQTTFSYGVGLPVAFGWRVLRVESGVFVQWVASDAARVRQVVNAPWRVWVRVAERVSVGLLGELTAANVGDGDASGVRAGVGLAAMVQMRPSLRLLGQVYYPTAHPFGTDAAGAGLSFVSSVR